VSIRIGRKDSQVVWSARRRDIYFNGAQRDAEIARAASDVSWKTADLMAARLVHEHVPTEALLARGLAFDWASGRVKVRRFTLFLHPTFGVSRQILLDVP
jgi:hypothetical protein